ncbi:MAG: 1-deoxy-D-xylulose-5-phosphate reductoisomerase [Bacillota bacterium]|nr:MAG: 1-deoxy-D-xylulose-5-phosphate reductoisomerase [Bacillota bacterium]
MKGLAILGATGSIGRQALEIAGDHPDRFRVVALAARRDVEGMVAAARRHRPELVAMSDPGAAASVREHLRPLGIEVLAGPEGLAAAATAPGVDLVVSAAMGFAGLEPTLAAVRAGRTIALANKETLVAAGPLVKAEAARSGARILPADSEHNALFQALAGVDRAHVERLWLTASGGPFRGFTPEQLAGVRPEQALRHPNWSMGAKITVDSATLMNKGLEVIEAVHLFDLPVDRIGVLVHPESLVHGLVELADGGFIAHIAAPDMRIPLGWCLAYPERLDRAYRRLNLVQAGTLTFEEPDRRTFPCLRLAEEAGRIGGTMPAVLNAANEVAVEAFLRQQLSFPGIAQVVESVVTVHRAVPLEDLETVKAADAWAREQARRVIRSISR